VKAGFHVEMDVGGACVNGGAAGEVFVPVVEVNALATDQQFEFFASDFAKRLVIIHQSASNAPVCPVFVFPSHEYLDKPEIHHDYQWKGRILLTSICRSDRHSQPPWHKIQT
jgi:hypothetical protein